MKRSVPRTDFLKRGALASAALALRVRAAESGNCAARASGEAAAREARV